MLHEALIALVLERGWDDIHVQDVCARANVGRSTFYTHFGDKEELLLSGFGPLHEQMRALVAKNGGKPLGFALALLEHTRSYQRVYRALLGKRSSQAVVKRLTQVVIDLLDEDVAVIPRGPRRDAAARYIAGAFVELLIWWLEGRTRLQAAEVNDIFQRLTVPVLAELPRLGAQDGSLPSRTTTTLSRPR
jgi:AcrR family transcriptional regulator